MVSFSSSVVYYTNNSSKYFVDKNVSKEFSDSVISQFNTLSEKYDGIDNTKLVILSSSDSEYLDEIGDNFSAADKYFSGNGKIAYGMYDKEDDTVFIIQDNHERKDTALEGELTSQGSDTLTHEIGHLVDTHYSSSDDFKKAYTADIQFIYEKLEENPEQKISDFNMSYEEAIEYFDHYLEGVDFSDGISDEDITQRGLRENFAEAFSIVEDNEQNSSNEIFKDLFPNTVNYVSEVCMQ